eukprot:gene7892-16155_t
MKTIPAMHLIISVLFNRTDGNDYQLNSLSLQLNIKNISQNLSAYKSIEIWHNKCLSKTSASLAVRKMNQIFDFNRKVSSSIPGVTYWINDYMAVGHAMYDIQLLELLRTTVIDRIIIQRGPCATSDLCRGRGTWKSFYEGLYSVIMHAANKSNVPVYFKFHGNERQWTPYMLGMSNITHSTTWEPIITQAHTCFDTLIRRRCNACFHNVTSVASARAFKRAAHAMLPPVDLSSPTSTNNLIVTIAHRGSHKRHL